MRLSRFIAFGVAFTAALTFGIFAFGQPPTPKKVTPGVKGAKQKRVVKDPGDRDGDHDREKKGGYGLEEDAPDKAHAWRMLAWRGSNGRIPADGRLRALAQRDANLAALKLKPSLKPVLPPLTPVWTSAGANNVGGRTNTIAICPTNTNLIFVGAAGGGVWKSINKGLTWSLVDDRWASLAMGAITFDPSNSNVIYAGTGEANLNGDAIMGGGIFKSTDGGNTWNLIPSTAAFQAVGSIAVNPKNSNEILVGTGVGGVELTTDGGTTWSNSLPAYTCFDIRYASDGKGAIASILDDNFDNYVAYSSDGGQTWAQASGTLDTSDSIYGRTQIQYAPSDNTIVYAVQGGFGTATPMKSTDGGHTFTSMTQNQWGFQEWYDNSLWVDPTNANHLVAGGIDLWQSLDGGQTWTQISEWALHYGDADLPHADQHSIVSDPGYDGKTDRTVYFGNDGGVYVANDILAVTPTGGWTGLNAGYTTTQFYGAVGESAMGTLLGGTQDNGTLQFAIGSPTGAEEEGGDGGFCAIDTTDPNYLYSEYVYGDVSESQDHGQTITDISGGISDVQNGNANFISPFILSPNNPNVLWVGCQNLWQTTNVKTDNPTWTAVSTTGVNISAIAEAPGNANVVWYGDSSGNVEKSINATATPPNFTPVSTPSAGRYVGRIAIDPTNPNIVYIGFGGFYTGEGGFGSNNLYKTTDGGSTWTLLAGSGATALPEAPIHGIAIDPLNTQQIFVATEVGLYATSDGGATWTTNAFGPNNACVDEVNFIAGTHTLLIATHGRGLWTAPIAIPGQVSTLTVSPTAVVAGGASTGTVTLASPASTGGQLVDLTSNQPSVGLVPATVTVPAGATTTTFPIATSGVDSAISVTISAIADQTGQAPVTATLQVNPASLAYVIPGPSTVYGGQASNLKVVLNGDAGPSQLVVNITDSTPSVASTGATLTIPYNATSATEPITTFPVNSSTLVTFGAAIGNDKPINGSLLVVPPTLSSISAAPSAIAGGAYGKLNAFLAAGAGPSGVVLKLTSSSPTIASVPSTMYLAPGTSSGSVPITTKAVSTATPVTFTAQFGSGAIRTCTLSILPDSVTATILAPNTVTGGVGSTLKVYLAEPAGPSGLTIPITDTSPGIASAGSTIFIPAGASQGSESVTTAPVNASTAVIFGASLPGQNPVTATLTIVPAQLASIKVVPATVPGGAKTVLYIFLNGYGGPGGTAVSLTSNNPSAAAVPATVIVPSRKSSTSVVITTSGVNSTSAVTFRAQIGSGTPQTCTLTVTPPSVTSAILSPASVAGGNPSTLKVSLSGPAGPGGVAVTVTDGNQIATSAGTLITIAAGATSGSEPITTYPVSTTTNVAFTASSSLGSAGATLAVTPASVSTVSASPVSVVGGNQSTITVSLAGVAGPTGLTINLSSGTPAAASVPSTLFISAGSSSGTATITTHGVSARTTVALSAHSSTGVVKSTTLTVVPASVVSVTATPSSVTGGNGSTLSVTLNGQAGPTGLAVSITDSASSIATAGASLTIAAGATSGSEPITTQPLNSSTVVTFGASTGGGTPVKGSLTVNPAGLASISANPSSVIGGSTSTLHINLNGVAGSAGVTVTLISNTPAAANVPASVFIPAGATSGSVQITTNPVGAATIVSFIAQAGSTVANCSFTVNRTIN